MARTVSISAKKAASFAAPSFETSPRTRRGLDVLDQREHRGQGLGDVEVVLEPGDETGPGGLDERLDRSRRFPRSPKRP